jgi:hypothetical protein
MSEATPHFAPIVVLLFLGAVFVTGVSILVMLYGSLPAQIGRWNGRRWRAHRHRGIWALALRCFAGEQ